MRFAPKFPPRNNTIAEIFVKDSYGDEFDTSVVPFRIYLDEYSLTSSVKILLKMIKSFRLLKGSLLLTCLSMA